MQTRTPKTLARTSSLSDAARFVHNFSGVSNVSSSGLRNHVTAIRVNYWFTIDRSSQAITNSTYTLFNLLSMIVVSHKAFGCQSMMSMTGVDIFHLMAWLGIVDWAILHSGTVEVKPGGTFDVALSLVWPWAPGLYGDCDAGVDPFDGAADASMFGNDGEVISEFNFVPFDASDTIPPGAFFHTQEVDIVSLRDLYVFSPKEFRRTNTLDNPAYLTGSFRKWICAWIRSDKNFLALPQLIGIDINLRVDGRAVHESVPAPGLLGFMLGNGGDMRAFLPAFSQIGANSNGLIQVPPGQGNPDYPRIQTILPLWVRGMTRGRGQIGPVGQSFEIQGASNCFLSPASKYLQYYDVARDRGMFATQIQRAGLNPADYNENTALVGGRKYIETHLTADDSVGLGIRWSNVAKG